MSIRICDFQKEYKEPIALALGFFDCMHVGHVRLVNCVNAFCAEHQNVKSALLTFTNDPNIVFGKEREIYSFEDRVSVLEKLSIDVVVGACFDSGFINTSASDFLKILCENFNIKFIAVGADYTFGKNASGNVDLLKDFCASQRITLEVVPFERVNGEKLSTSNLKSLVKSGAVDVLNPLLSQPYFVSGRVLHAKHNGTPMGFPTANLAINKDRLPLCSGIYATICTIDGVDYPSMTNVGAKPTFDDDSPSIETYIFDFCQDLYGKQINVGFIKRTRDIIKFEDASALKNRLHQDETVIREILNNRGKI